MQPQQRPYTQAFAKKLSEDNNYVGMRQIDLVFISNWGRPDFIGLTGLEIISEPDSPVKLYEANLSCNFKGPLDCLVDDKNLTTDPKHMWTLKYNPEKHIVLTIKFDTYTYISGKKMLNTFIYITNQTTFYKYIFFIEKSCSFFFHFTDCKYVIAF